MDYQETINNCNIELLKIKYIRFIIYNNIIFLILLNH